MQKLIFATNNKHKIGEALHILHNQYHILSLHEIGFDEEIPETSPTIAGNASQKAWYVYNKVKQNCFADDTGLEVDALNGEPGVHSARYAGDSHDFYKNVEKLLKEMQGVTDRKARFRTVISLIIDGKETQFEGILNGTIIYERKGDHGFGYDPVFIPEGYSETLAEITPAEKNRISHRSLGLQKMAEYLKNGSR